MGGHCRGPPDGDGVKGKVPGPLQPLFVFVVSEVEKYCRCTVIALQLNSVDEWELVAS